MNSVKNIVNKYSKFILSYLVYYILLLAMFLELFPSIVHIILYCTHRYTLYILYYAIQCCANVQLSLTLHSVGSLNWLMYSIYTTETGKHCISGIFKVLNIYQHTTGCLSKCKTRMIA